MLTANQSRNYTRCQRLSIFLSANNSVYSTYIPFANEAQNFTINFSLLKSLMPSKDIKGNGITTIQKDLKLKIAGSVGSICDTACAYAEQYGNTKLLTDICHNKTDVLRQKDADVRPFVLHIVNILQPLLGDADFMQYEITQTMLGAVMTDATAFNDNIGKAGVIDNGSSVANQNINGVIKLLDKNVKQFDRLLNRFTRTHPDFVSGFRINAALEQTGVHHTGLEGVVTDATTKAAIKNARIEIESKKKEAVTNAAGNYSIISMRGGECEIAISAPGYTTKKVKMHILQGKVAKLNIAL